MPLDDPERVGRLRDHLAILAEGGDARLQAMDLSRLQHAQANGIGEAIAELTTALTLIDREQADHRVRTAEIEQAYLGELTAAFVHLGLTEDQENVLADMARHTHQQFCALRERSSSASDRLRDVVLELGLLVGK